MTENLLGELDVAIARGLRAIDFAAGLAENLKAADPGPEASRSIERALRARQAIIEIARIPLPPLREAADPPAPPIDMDKDLWSVAEIAQAAGLHRNTIMRRAHALGGEIAAKLSAALREGTRPHFTLTEAHIIMNAGGTE